MNRFSLPLILLSIAGLSGVSQAQDDMPVHEDSYLGQTPPGQIPEVFAPGIVTTDRFEYGATFTPDLKEFYFTRATGEGRNREFVAFKNEGGQWVETIISRALGQPLISPDGKVMHLGRRYQERTEDGWSEVQELDQSFREENRFIMRMSSAENGTYYFDTFDETNPEFPLRYSRLVNGQREAPKALSEVINTGTQLNHPFIAPDESYLIWDAKREDGFGDSDIYISFRDKDGNWGAAINLGDKMLPRMGSLFSSTAQRPLMIRKFYRTRIYTGCRQR